MLFTPSVASSACTASSNASLAPARSGASGYGTVDWVLVAAAVAVAVAVAVVIAVGCNRYSKSSKLIDCSPDTTFALAEAVRRKSYTAIVLFTVIKLT